MSTALPLDDKRIWRQQAPVTWFLFDDAADRIYTSLNKTWDDLSEPHTDKDDKRVPLVYSLTKQPMNKLILFLPRDDFPCEIVPPEPVPFFSFARYGIPLKPFLPSAAPTPPNWLYSLFGFFFDDYRFTWKICNDDKVIATIAMRSTPLAL